MSTSRRLISAIFTALPGSFFFASFLLRVGREEYWWETYLVVLSVLVFSGLFFGFVIPMILKKWRHPWLWILAQGLLAWTLALLVLALLNLTPLCVGQNNADGNNDLRLCIFMTVLSGIVYTPVYLGVLAISAVLGHGTLSLLPESPASTGRSFTIGMDT